MRREGAEEEKEKNDRGKERGRRMRNLG